VARRYAGSAHTQRGAGDGRERAAEHRDADPVRLPRRWRRPGIHPCRRVQEALHAAGIEYRKVIAGHGSPIPFLRKGSREDLLAETGDTKLPTLKLADRTVVKHSRAILAWIKEQG
jgi:glutathione S-transferase